MTKFTEPTWHRESYDRFLQERLPELLADRIPLTGYKAEFTSETTARVTVTINGPKGEVSTTFDDLARPDVDGLLWSDVSNNEREHGPLWRHAKIVLPYADNEDLTVANIKCIGERLYDYVEERLGEAGEGLPWDETLLRSWAPLDVWFDAMYHDRPKPGIGLYNPQAQWLDKTNWLATQIHIRRLVIPGASGDLKFGNIGLVSPLETPEGPNVNKICSIAAGATIKDGRLISVDSSPEAGFGLPALLIPFIEHSSDARLVMSCNMQRQWLPTLSPEPALVQTGWEPDAPGFWCGRNLLTAYIPWGESTFEDAVVISESAAKRFPTEIAITQSYRDAYHPVQAGDWLSNRHGAKCTIGRILPDAEMPHLAGVPVDLVYSPSGVISRLNLGQLWEAAASRIAQATGEPLIAPPFHGQTQEELRATFVDLGLPEDGLAQLTTGADGPPLERASCVGWVYWGRLDHEPADRLAFATPAITLEGLDSYNNNLPVSSQRQGYLEYAALRDIGAFETIREHYNTRSVRNADVGTLAARVASGSVDQSTAPSPAFADLTARLAAAGVKAAVDGGRLAFSVITPPDPRSLARPVAHPWLRDVQVTTIGKYDINEYVEIERVNAQVDRLIRSGAPERLVKKGVVELEAAVVAYFEALIDPAVLRWSENVVFSGRAVLSPGSGLTLDEVSMPESLAWGLFSPMVVAKLGDAEAVAKRTPAATQALDDVMAASRVLLYSVYLYAQPEHSHAPLLAVRPRRGDGVVIRIHNRVTSLMNIDFDGDQIAVFLPVTEAGQREAEELLTPQAYIRRDPGVLEALRPSMDAMWGLARLSLDDAGRRELAELGIDPLPVGLLTKSTVTSALTRIYERDGIDAAIDAADRMRDKGYEVARRSGWSMGPFLGHSLNLPPKPASDDWAEAWPRYVEEVTDILTRKTTFDDSDIDPARMSVMCGARGLVRQLLTYVAGWGSVQGVDGEIVPMPHSLVEGITPEESTLLAFGLRRGWYESFYREMRRGSPISAMLAAGRSVTVDAPNVSGYHVLARAMRAQCPGAVFARAAAVGEVDPLTSTDSRLFVGLMPE